MVAYTFYLKELSDSSTWQDISSAVVKDSFQLKKGFGALSSALDTSSLSIQIHMATLADAAALHVSQKQLKMQIDGATVFEGVSFDSANIDLGQSTDLVHVRMKFKPYSSLFADAVVPSDTALTDVRICDGTDTAHSLIHLLFDMIVTNLPSPMPDILSGSFSVSTTISNTTTLPLVLLEAGESVLDYLTDVLYQNGYAFYMDQFAAIVVEPYATGRTPSDTLAITSIIDNPKISQAPYVVEKRCVVRFPRISSYSNEVVYELNKERDNGTGEPSQVIVLADGDYYPMDSDDAASVLEADYGSDRETDDIELAHVATPALSYVAKKLSGATTVDATLSVEISELQSKLAKVQLLNDIEGVDVSLRNIVVTAGIAYYRDWSEKYQDNDTTSTRKDEIDGLYMPDSATAQGFVARYRAEIDAERTLVTFQTHLVFAPNALITITGLPYNLLIRRATQLNDSHDLYEYDCVAYSLQAITVGGIIQIHRDTRPHDGLDSYLMQLAAPQGTVIRVSGRGTLETTTLKLTALTANIEASAITWAALVGTLSEVSGEPFSRSLACSTVSANQTTITISATIGGVTFSASVGIQKVYTTTLPLALGTVTSLPTTVGGEALVAGDYVLVGSSFTVGEVTFGVGQIWEYTGSAWALSTDGAKAMAMMDNFAQLTESPAEGVFNNLVAKRFIALEATVKQLGALYFKLLEDGTHSGCIHSDKYLTDGSDNPSSTATKGIYLGANGLAKLWKAVLEEVTITGDGEFGGDIVNELFKVQKGLAGSELTIPAATGWLIEDAYDALTTTAEVSTEFGVADTFSQYYASATSVTGTFGTKNVVKLARLNSNGSRGFYSYNGLKFWYDDDSFEIMQMSQITALALVLSSPSFNSSSILTYRSMAAMSEALALLPNGVLLTATGTMTIGGTSRSITGVTPYSTYFIVAWTGGTKTYYASDWVTDTGSLTPAARADVVETTTVTPKNSTDDIGKSDDKFRDGWFSNSVNIGTPTRASNGSSSIPNGMIVKWGMVSLAQDDDETISFPVAFPNDCISAMVQGTTDSGLYTNGLYVGPLLSATTLRIRTRSTSQDCYWLALGY